MIPAPTVEYGLLSPMLIVFGAAVAGVLVEAFVPRAHRFGAQLALALGGLIAAFVAVVCVARELPAEGRLAAMGAVAVDRPALLLQGTLLLIGIVGILLIADEIISFRVGYQGASARFGFQPDLVTLGKIIGGGLPVAAYGGRGDLMDRVSPAGPMRSRPTCLPYNSGGGASAGFKVLYI